MNDSSSSTPPSSRHDQHPSPPHRRWWRRKRLWLTVLFVIALYPTVVTLALWTGVVERALASEDLRVEIDNPSYSLIPGHIHLKKARVYLNGSPQFVMFADDIEARIQILPLFEKKFALSWLGAKNVVFRLRVPLEGEAANAPRTAAFPRLEGLPGKNAISIEEAQEGEEGDSPWTVALHDLNVSFSELWFFEYRYVGPGTLRGGFERGPYVLDIDAQLKELGPGKLYYGEDQVISHNFRGGFQAKIPRMNPSEHANLSFFDFVHIDLEFLADIVALDHVGAYVPGVTFSEGGGLFHADVEMQGGRLGSSTVISYETKEVNVKTLGFGLKTDWSVHVDMPQTDPGAGTSPSDGEESSHPAAPTSDGEEPAPDSAEQAAPTDEQEANKQEADKQEADKQEANKQAGKKETGAPEGPRVESHSKATYVSFAAIGKEPFTIQLHGHSEKAALASAQIDENLDVARANLHFPKIVSTDLRDMESVTGEGLGSDGGEAEASLDLEMNEEKDFEGPFDANLDGLDLAIDPLQASVNGKAKAHVTVSVKNEAAAFRNVDIALRNMTFVVGENTVENWWLSLASERIAVGWADPSYFMGNFHVTAKDAEPLLRVLAEDEKIPDVVPALMKLRDLETRAEVRMRGDVLDLMLENVNTSFIDFAGRVYQHPEGQRMALLVGGKAVSLGVVQQGDQKRFKALAHADWLNEQLKDFPRPVQRVEGQQP